MKKKLFCTIKITISYLFQEMLFFDQKRLFFDKAMIVQLFFVRNVTFLVEKTHRKEQLQTSKDRIKRKYLLHKLR